MLSARVKSELVGLGAALFLGAFLIDFGDSSEFVGLLGDALHVPIFAAASAGIYLLLLHKGFSKSASTLVAALLGGSTAAGIELIQPFFGRSESLIDLENGLLGSMIGVSAVALMGAGSRMLRGIFYAASVCGCVAALLPAFGEWQVLQHQNRQLPLLGDFEDPRELRLWSGVSERPPFERVRRSTKHVKRGSYSLKAELATKKSSGIELRLNDMSWEGFDEVVVEVFNPGAPTRLEMRVDDFKDCSDFRSRFNRSAELPSGWSTIRTRISDIRTGPTDRELHIERLYRLLLFVLAREEAASLYFDDIRLE